MPEQDLWPEYADETDEQRRVRFQELNNRIWGEGNWVECDNCLDGRGKPSFHHKDHHSPDVIEFLGLCYACENPVRSNDYRLTNKGLAHRICN